MNEEQKAKIKAADVIPEAARVDIEHLYRLCSRTKAVVRSQVEPVPEGVRGNDPAKFTIATISLRLTEKDFRAVPVTVGLNRAHSIFNLKEEPFNAVTKALVEQIEEVGKKAQFICTHELGFPACADVTEASSQAEERLEQDLISLACKNNAYILPGTYHCRDRLYNLAPLFYPGQTKNDKPFLHAKRTCASSENIGERILVPYNRMVRFYQTKHCLIGMLVCLDSYDPSLIIQLVREKFVQHRDLDILFVPSFNPQPKGAREVCKDLSYLLACIVVLTNVQTYGGHGNNVWMCGEEVTTVKEVSTLTKLYTIDFREYRNKASEIRVNMSSTFKRILGIADTSRTALPSGN